MRQTIDRYLDAIDHVAETARFKARFFIEFAIDWDSNVNSATRVDSVAVPVFGNAVFSLTPGSMEKHDNFFSVNAGTNIANPLGGNWSLIGGLSVYQRNYLLQDDFSNGYAGKPNGTQSDPTFVAGDQTTPSGAPLGLLITGTQTLSVVTGGAPGFLPSTTVSLNGLGAVTQIDLPGERAAGDRRQHVSAIRNRSAARAAPWPEEAATLPTRPAFSPDPPRPARVSCTTSPRAPSCRPRAAAWEACATFRQLRSREQLHWPRIPSRSSVASRHI